MNATTRRRAPLPRLTRLLGAPRRAISRGMANPAVLRRGMSLWPPFLGAGVVVEELDREWRSATVRLRRSPFNANYVGTQFGGSLFSMCDPWFMLLVLRRMGPGYVVWDRRGEIEFVAPGRTAVRASFEVDDERIEALRAAAAGGDKVLEWFEAEIKDADGALVARYRKQVYVRAKRS
ncbi:MAG: DUF4442 domain-containing protein [Arthrobacter sp.]|nr:DUF4442 domain-containing protein [Arthrobacter sp.]